MTFGLDYFFGRRGERPLPRPEPRPDPGDRAPGDPDAGPVPFRREGRDGASKLLNGHARLDASDQRGCRPERRAPTGRASLSRGFDTGPNYDEGVYLASDDALDRGERLGEDVFSSQPPGFYLLLRFATALPGESVDADRALFLAVAIGGVAGAWALGRALTGAAGGLLAAAALLAAPAGIGTESFRVAADSPAVAIALVGLGLLAWSLRWSSPALAVFAGCAIAASVSVKLFAVTALVPAVGLLVAFRPPRRVVLGFLLGGAAGRAGGTSSSHMPARSALSTTTRSGFIPARGSSRAVWARTPSASPRSFIRERCSPSSSWQAPLPGSSAAHDRGCSCPSGCGRLRRRRFSSGTGRCSTTTSCSSRRRARSGPARRRWPAGWPAGRPAVVASRPGGRSGRSCAFRRRRARRRLRTAVAASRSTGRSESGRRRHRRSSRVRDHETRRHDRFRPADQRRGIWPSGTALGRARRHLVRAVRIRLADSGVCPGDHRSSRRAPEQLVGRMFRSEPGLLAGIEARFPTRRTVGEIGELFERSAASARAAQSRAPESCS